VVRKDSIKTNVPKGLGTLRKPPRPEAEAELLKESISLLKGEATPGRKISSCWPLLRIMRRIRMDQAPFYWASKGLWSK
jgi:hypothetical protein